MGHMLRHNYLIVNVLEHKVKGGRRERWWTTVINDIKKRGSWEE